MTSTEITIDDHIDQVAEQEAEDVLTGYGLTESDANDAAWDTARVIAPRAIAFILERLASRDGETISTEYLRELAEAWRAYEHR